MVDKKTKKMLIFTTIWVLIVVLSMIYVGDKIW